MTIASLSAIIDSPAARVHDILLAAPELPDWNPAFVRVDGPARATTGVEYRLDVTRGLRGTLTYTRSTATRSRSPGVCPGSPRPGSGSHHRTP